MNLGNQGKQLLGLDCMHGQITCTSELDSVVLLPVNIDSVGCRTQRQCSDVNRDCVLAEVGL